MKLLGRDIPARELVARIEDRLRARGLYAPSIETPREPGVEPRVDPLSFNLEALEQHADATQAMPRSERGPLSAGVRWLFRKSCQPLIEEALARQRVFNAHVVDSYAQLSAEVLALRDEVARLKVKKPR